MLWHIIMGSFSLPFFFITHSHINFKKMQINYTSAAAALGEGIRLVFGRWTALQMAVENQWGGRDSRAKADQFGESIHSWFCRSRGPHYFEDLVDMMYDTISDSFNADFEDNSVEEVAEQLLIIHEECLQSNYSSIEKLRNSHVQGNAVSQSRQVCAVSALH
jgi:pre-rRNA-processing protein TSR2